MYKGKSAEQDAQKFGVVKNLHPFGPIFSVSKPKIHSTVPVRIYMVLLFDAAVAVWSMSIGGFRLCVHLRLLLTKRIKIKFLHVTAAASTK